MAKVRFNLKASRFPMLSQFFGPSVAIRSNGDTDYIVTDAYSGTAANDELGIAQPIYMHNVLPVSHGYQSVDFKTVLDNFCENQGDFDQVIQVEDFNGMNHMLSPAGGQNFVGVAKFDARGHAVKPAVAVDGQVVPMAQEGRDAGIFDGAKRADPKRCKIAHESLRLGRGHLKRDARPRAGQDRYSIGV